MSLIQRIQAVHSAEFVPLIRVADIVERLEQGQIPSAETQTAAWAQVWSALLILLHAGVHSIKGSAVCGNEGCPLNEEVDV